MGSNDGFLYSLNADTGEQNWKVKGKGRVYSPIIAGQALYFDSGKNAHITAVNRDSGKVLWQFEAAKGANAKSPVIADGILYLSSFWSIIALN